MPELTTLTLTSRPLLTTLGYTRGFETFLTFLTFLGYSRKLIPETFWPLVSDPKVKQA